MTRNLSSRSAVSLLFFVVNFEGHVEDFFMLTLVGLKYETQGDTYLEAVQLVAQVLLLVEQLLQTIR